jgi:hypothetical protein
MASIVLSFVGNQDPYSNRTNSEGSLITLLRFLLDQSITLRKVVLLHTEGTAQNAHDTEAYLASEPVLQGLSVELMPTGWELSKDPTDLVKAAQEARRGLEWVKQAMEPGDRIEFNASSGTPAMKSAFSLLQAAGYAGSSQVWQVRDPTQMQPDQTRVFPTDVSVLRREFDLQILRQLVAEFDYQAARELWQRLGAADPVLERLLGAAAAWNRGEFAAFFRQAKGQLSPAAQRQGSTWWWQGYEQAYAAVVRLAQGNTTEALQHSHRAVEGMINRWAIATFPEAIADRPGAYALVSPQILDRFPTLQGQYEQQRDRHPSGQVGLQGYFLRALLETAIPATRQHPDFVAYWESAREARNQVSHRWGGMSQQECFQAWGPQVRSQADWEGRILHCLNTLSGQTFVSLRAAALLSQIHDQILTLLVS